MHYNYNANKSCMNESCITNLAKNFSIAVAKTNKLERETSLKTKRVVQGYFRDA